MRKLSLAEIVMDEVDMDALECAIREMIRECIDYGEIASEIVSELDITKIVMENVEELPF